MKQLGTYFFAAFLFMLVGFKPDLNYKNYCNERFGFCIDYPKEFKAEGESENGDGQVFTSKDKATEIRAYGMLAIEEFDKLSQQYETATKGIKVTYKVIKDTWFIYSGTDKNGNIVYCKTVKKSISYMNDENTKVFQTLMITYPAAQKNTYSAYCAKIAKSL